MFGTQRSATRETSSTSSENERKLMSLLNEESNKYCADCGQKGARWASWNLGVFLCIRCAGLHRNLGTHISRVKSVNLDKWTDEQVECIASKGNAKVNAIYVPDAGKYVFPSYTGDQEQFIRDKYERKLFMTAAGGEASRPRDLGSREIGEERYSQQLRYLRDMGFTDSNAGLDALKACDGNMQKTVERLLAHKTGGSSPDGRDMRLGSGSGSTSRNVTDDLVDIFGAPVGPAGESEKRRPVEDDLPSDDFEDFEGASQPPVEYRPAESRMENVNIDAAMSATSGTADMHSGMGYDASYFDSHSVPDKKEEKPPAALPSLASMMGNPWATASSNNASTDNPFDDIDPFRGFNPRSRG